MKWLWGVVAVLIVIVAGLPCRGFTQETKSDQGLRWFAGVKGEYLSVSEFRAPLLGAQVGIQLSEHWYLGLEALTEVIPGAYSGAYPAWGPSAAWDREYTYDRVGLLVGHRFPSSNRIQFNPELAAGIAWLKQEAVYPDVYEDFFGYPYDVNPAFHGWLQGRLGLEATLTDWMRLAAHLGLHFPLGIESYGRKDEDFRGMTFQLSLRFGRFPDAG